MTNDGETFEQIEANLNFYKSEYPRLKSELANAKADLDQTNQICLEIMRERDAAKAEIEHWQTRTSELLKQKDGIDPDVFGTVCYERDVSMNENKRLREALENVKKHCEIVMPSGTHLMGVYRIAQSALDGGEKQHVATWQENMGRSGGKA